MEKRVLIAALLSALFLSVYSQFIMKPARPTVPPQSDPLAQGQLRQEAQQTIQEAEPTHANYSRNISTQHIEQEEVVTIESDDLALEIGESSGAIRRATLKQFSVSSGAQALEFSGILPLLRVQIGDEPLSWRLVSASAGSATMQATDGQDNSYRISYAIDSSNPLIQIELRAINLSAAQNDRELVITTAWKREGKMNGRTNLLEAMVVTEIDGGKIKHKRHIAPWSRIKDVPRGTVLASLAERYFSLSLRPDSGVLDVALLPSDDDMAVMESRAKLGDPGFGSNGYSAEVYIGPRDYFHLKRVGFESAFPIGMLGQIGIILLFMLRAIAGVTHNYGVAIVAFSLLVTCATAPFTLMSFRSMKKMQELKPEMDRIMAQHKDDPTRANKEVFALYKQHKVSPISGCLPMLLQMPIFIALFQAISHFIELRGERFLWIQDLSLPDRLAKLPFTIPFIGGYLNLLPIIMALAMYFQSRRSQGQMGAQAQNNPMAKMMSGPTMSIIFGVMFYQFPAGLVLYWLTNTLMSLVWYRLAK